MCSAKEVQKIVDLAISELEHRQDQKLHDSHMAVAKSVSEFGNELRKLTDKLDGVIKFTDGVGIIKSFLVGLASIILAITAIGGSVIWFFKTFVTLK